MVDFIIVGRGLAATVMMHALRRAGNSFTCIGEPSLSSCSRVAAGIWNPVVFNRMTKSWIGEELIDSLGEFYTECGDVLKTKLITKRRLYRSFSEEQEKALWKKKAAAELGGFIDPRISEDIPVHFKNLKIANGYSEVLRCGNLDVPRFIDSSAAFFAESIITAVFSHDNLRIEKDRVVYEGITAGNIVFCEGHLVRTNPFFSWLPMKPAKGEILTIAAKDIQIKDEIFNKNGFLMDTGNGQFRVGATYEWSCLDDTITESGLAELKQKLDNMISCGYTVLKQEAGVRPSSSDRRPLLGNHPVHERVHIFNGLGTKGVMLAPYLAGKFVLCFHKNTGLHPEVDIKRFYHLYDGNSKA